MTRAQEIRKEVLFQLYGGKGIPVSPGLVVRRSKHAGNDYSEDEIRDALYFLKGQGLAEVVNDTGSGAVLYRITSAGMIEYENN